MNIADRFAQIEAEYKAIEKLYKAVKAEALEACMDACGPSETKSTVAGDLFLLNFSLVPVNAFSAEKAKAFLTPKQIEACMVQNSRQILKSDLKAKAKNNATFKELA